MTESAHRRRRAAPAYTADDFRAELRRVKRKRRLLSFVCIALALAIIAFALQAIVVAS